MRLPPPRESKLPLRAGIFVCLITVYLVPKTMPDALGAQ